MSKRILRDFTAEQVETLPPYHRRVMGMRLEGLTVVQIARVVGRSYESVKKAIDHARYKMGVVRPREIVPAQHDPAIQARAVELLQQGMRVRDAARLVGRSCSVVYAALAAAEQLAGKPLYERFRKTKPDSLGGHRMNAEPLLAALGGSPRCSRCSLLLDSDEHECLGRIEDYVRSGAEAPGFAHLTGRR